MSVTANVNITVGVNETSTANTAGQASDGYTAQVAQTFSSGTGNNQANVQWSTSPTVGLNGSTTFNLQSLAGSLGTKSFSTIRGFLLQNLDANNTISVAPASSNGFSGPFTASEVVQPGGMYLSYAPAAGWPVTSTTNGITLTTSAAVKYALVIFGA